MNRHALLNGRQLAAAIFRGSENAVAVEGQQAGEWAIYAIKKANKQFAEQRTEDLIFTGRYSTIAKITNWLEAHSDFVPSQVLRKKHDPAPGTESQNKRRPRQPLAA